MNLPEHPTLNDLTRCKVETLIEELYHSVDIANRLGLHIG